MPSTPPNRPASNTTLSRGEAWPGASPWAVQSSWAKMNAAKSTSWVRSTSRSSVEVPGLNTMVHGSTSATSARPAGQRVEQGGLLAGGTEEDAGLRHARNPRARICHPFQVKQTAIIGAGVMGETLLSGLVRAGRRVDQLLVGEKRAERAAELEERYGVAVVSNVEAATKADTLALVVKPQDMGEVLDEIAGALRPGQLVVSLAAGITTAFIESRVPDGVAVVRVMPNTPALVDEGMAAISPGSHCDEEHLTEAEELMASVGRVVRIPERQQDAVTAISGSGPAYIFFVVESMIEAGVHLGLPRATASDLVIQTLVGSAKMLRETGTHPTVLREQVTSPGGTTASALRELEIHKVRAAFLAAMEAARDRSRELAEGS